jgi:excisionase family DNA binding protein
MTRLTDLMTEQEVAAMLRVTPSTVSRWASKGLIPVIVLPSGRRRFRRVDLERLTLPIVVEVADVGPAIAL